MKFSGSIQVIALLFFAANAQAVDRVEISSERHPLSPVLGSLVDPEDEVAEGQVFKGNPYLGADRILLLGDTFESTPKRFPMVQAILNFLKPHQEVYRTSLDCPPQLDSAQIGPVRNFKIDHRDPLPFAESFFDVIVLRRGLCFCKGKEETCGGIGKRKFFLKQFFSEVARVLNKANPEAVAYLHGIHWAFTGRGALNHEEEAKIQKKMEAVLASIEQEYKDLRFTMIYRKMFFSDALEKFPFKAGTLGASSNRTSEILTFFEGILIQVRGPQQEGLRRRDSEMVRESSNGTLPLSLGQYE